MTNVQRVSDLIQEISQYADTNGEAIAIVDESRRVTYAQLSFEVEGRAHGLRKVGVVPGDRIAVVAENSAAYLIAILAIWTVDGVPMTIYSSTSEDDLRATLTDADPVLVYADDRTHGLVQAAAGDRIPVARLDLAESPTSLSTSAAQTPDHFRDELALVCYSSGTTARPKAIMLSSKAILNSAHTFAETWRLTAADVTLVCLPMAWLFGLTTASITTLAAGGTVVSLKRAKPELIVDTIHDHGVTFLPAVTTVLTKLANHLDTTVAPDLTSTLRLIVSGGEPRNEESFERLRTHVGVPVHDNYCASEMQPLVTYDPVVDPEPRRGASGKLVPRSELRILNAAGQPVSTGEVGEGFSHGPGIMLGYWNDPEATAAAITKDGWYRTKDLLRFDEDGYVHVVGRTSDMIIRGGSNVSPGEIEQHLRKHPAIADIAVVGMPDPLYGEEIVAVIQSREAEAFDADELRRFATTGLAGFKVPTRYVRVDSLPHNATGKVNRKTVKQQLKAEEIA